VAAPGGLRGAGDAPVLVVEEATGRLVGTVDEPSAQIMVHDGAVYLHQGDSYLVSRLDLADRQAQRLRLRRVRRRRGLRRAGLPGRPGLAHRDPAGHLRVRLQSHVASDQRKLPEHTARLAHQAKLLDSSLSRDSTVHRRARYVLIPLAHVA
jgi:ATP-dependent helicase YprA (DUF1998 family)